CEAACLNRITSIEIASEQPDESSRSRVLERSCWFFVDLSEQFELTSACVVARPAEHFGDVVNLRERVFVQVPRVSGSRALAEIDAVCT
ncbi:hypothetical protein, partial [Microbacterium gubbeenense]|uniref:hypothetical protein n=1 Tax=Microbacterium gubbeenense TaxID=159896 RepID=UPI003F9DEF51